MRYTFKSLASLVLLILFSWYITPKEVMHLFTHHEDTEHVESHGHGLHITGEHHHCELLKADQYFSADEYNFFQYDFSQKELFLFDTRESFYKGDYKPLYVSQLSLRGPPSLS